MVVRLPAPLIDICIPMHVIAEVLTALVADKFDGLVFGLCQRAGKSSQGVP